MQMLTRTLSACALLSSVAMAQQVGVPAIFANAEAGSSGNIWRNGTNRVQGFYDTTNFTSQGIDYPIIVNSIDWRAAGGLTGTAGSYPSVDIFLCSSPSDFLAPSTTFATNVGADYTLVYSGPVNFAAPSGTTPNDWYINLPLTTNFTYNPGAGLDLMVEIVINAAPTVAPATLSCGYSAAAHFCNSIRSVGSTTALTGSLSAFAPVVRLGYTEPLGVAKRATYGAGCYEREVSFFEQFLAGTFDLGGRGTTPRSIQMSPNAQGGYDVANGGANWFVPLSADLALGDDAVSAAQPLSFTFNFPGGSTNAIFVGSNGNLWLVAAGAATATGTGNALCLEGARLSPYWTDLDPSAAAGAGSVHFDEDTVNGVAYVTWLGVPMWEATPSTPRFLNTFQVALHSTGLVEFRYMDCSAPTYTITTGFSPGNGARVPAGVDLTAAVPFSTATDLASLSLSASARPILGTGITMDTNNIPAAALLGSLMLNFGGVQPGVSLAGMGMPGCDLNISPFFISNLPFLGGSASVSTPIGLPVNPAFVGFQAQFQSVALVPGINAFGAVTSNGASLLLGSL